MADIKHNKNKLKLNQKITKTKKQYGGAETPASIAHLSIDDEIKKVLGYDKAEFLKALIENKKLQSQIETTDLQPIIVIPPLKITFEGNKLPKYISDILNELGYEPHRSSETRLKLQPGTYNFVETKLSIYFKQDIIKPDAPNEL